MYNFLIEISNLEKLVLKEQKESKLECPNCKSEMVYGGFRTADPWPEEDGPHYHVEAYSCKNCNKHFEYLPQKME